MSAPNAIVLGVRIGTALGLLALLVFGLGRDAGRGRALIVTGATSHRVLAAELASDATGAIVYEDSVPPSRAIAGLLATGSVGGRSVSLRTPAELPVLSVRPPRDPIAQRRAALTVTVRGDASQPVRLTIEDGAGQTDTVTVVVGPSGSTTTQVAVEPARAGVERWTVRAGDASGATAMAWVRPPVPLRVLVLTGPPDWEARYLVRSLESSGLDVVVRQDLGRDLVVTSDPGAAPTTLDHLAPFDVVVSAGADQRSLVEVLSQWVRDAGGGLLLLGGDGGATQTLAPLDLTWSGPAELIPLPALDIEVTGTSVAINEDGSAVPVASTGGAGSSSERVGVASAFVTAATLGRGRILRSGLETWPWVLEGGLADAHAAYWSSVVEWLADGLTEDVLLTGPSAQPYAAWQGRLEGAVPETVSVGSDIDTDVLVVSRATADRGRLRFVPTATGLHTLSREEDAALGATEPTALAATQRSASAAIEHAAFAAVVVRPAEERLSWAEAALEVGGSGASIVPADGADPLDAISLDDGDGRAWLLFLALAGLMGAGWTIRRVMGLT